MIWCLVRMSMRVECGIWFWRIVIFILVVFMLGILCFFVGLGVFGFVWI